MPDIHRHKKTLTVVPLLIFVLLATVFFYSKYNEDDKSYSSNKQIYASDLTRETIDTSIALSARYLVNHCDGQGQFVYRVNLNPDVEIKPKYNILRHAGSVYALAMYLGRYSDDEARKALIRSSRFLIEKTIRPVPGEDGVHAAWSPVKLCGRKGEDEAKLGGTGIGLVALIETEKVLPGTISLEQLRRMGNFILYMQKNDGSFYSKYLPEKGGRDDAWTSLYYPGEAALGLLMLFDRDPSPRWLESATDALSYLSHQRQRQVMVEADHWALLATEKLLKAAPPVPKNDFIRHGEKICRSILRGVPKYHEDAPEYGALTAIGSTTQTAIRLEGLLAAMSFLPEKDAMLKKRIDSAVREGMVFLLRSQIREGEYTGGFPRIAPTFALMNKKESKGDKIRDGEIRIDYIQHAMCAMMQYSGRFL